MGDPEAVLLVNYNQPQIGEDDVLGEQPVGPDNHIHQPLFQISQNLFLLRRGFEPGEDLDPDRVGREPLHKTVAVLFGQDRGRDQEGHLFAVQNRLKSAP